MEYSNILDNIKSIHLIGIGGSGMCPIAEILISMGFHVTGSDIYESDTLKHIKNLGIKVFSSHRAQNISDAELVVYSAAISATNPEILAAKKENIPVIERSVMMGVISRKYSQTIAVSGTHGKTTTTAMITQIMIKANTKPTAIIGGTLPFIKGNSIVGDSSFLICEACEYVDTFLQLSPYISVILNIDEDHLDYFKNLRNIKNSFNKFAKQTKKAIVINGDDINSMDAISDIRNKDVITFGFKDTNDYYAEDISDNKGFEQYFSVMHKGAKLYNISLNVPGRHNILNALAAIAVASYLGIDKQNVESSLKQFTGVHRRFEFLGKVNNITVADDFAHHPTELAATLRVANNMGFNNVWAVFQPHTYSRTYLLFKEFVKVLSIADKLVLSEILPVREVNTYNIHTKDLAQELPGSVWFSSFEEIAEYVARQAKPNDLILTLGGGNIYVCANMILEKLKAINKTDK